MRVAERPCFQPRREPTIQGPKRFVCEQSPLAVRKAAVFWGSHGASREHLFEPAPRDPARVRRLDEFVRASRSALPDEWPEGEAAPRSKTGLGERLRLFQLGRLLPRA